MQTEEQHKKALEEDPSVFDYDGIYDEMKEKVVRPIAQDRQERKPRYIQALIKKAKVREREHEIVYERKLGKEISKEDHLFADKDKYVTSAHKKKLAEQAKWLEEERLRQLREEKEDITKKGDMTEFYFSLSKNVAFGAREGESNKPDLRREESRIHSLKGKPQSKLDPLNSREGNHGETSTASKERPSSAETKPLSDSRKQGDSHDSLKQEVGIKGVVNQPTTNHHKRNQDALAAAKERFLARKKTKISSNDTPEEAATVYGNAAVKLKGPDTVTNFAEVSFAEAVIVNDENPTVMVTGSGSEGSVNNAVFSLTSVLLCN